MSREVLSRVGVWVAASSKPASENRDKNWLRSTPPSQKRTSTHARFVLHPVRRDLIRSEGLYTPKEP